MLLNTTLSNIVDTKLISDYEGDDDVASKAVAGLAKAYREKASHNSQYRDLADDAVGGDLKTSIALMTAEDQVNMLFTYGTLVRGESIDGTRSLENPKERDVRRAYIWVSKAAVITFCFCFVVVVTTVSVIGVRTGEIKGGEVISTFLTTAADIAKTIWGTPDNKEP
jgi:hypothetical protein